MHDGDINYSRYTLLELEEALAGINHQRYPRNYANLRAAYQALTSRPAPQPSPPVEAVAMEELEPQPRFDEHGRYIPNQIPPGERVTHVLLSLVLLV